MIRLGNWLKHSKGAKTINYLIVPGEVNGKKVKGVDDFFAAGGTINELRAAATTTQPNPHLARDTFTDARLAETSQTTCYKIISSGSQGSAGCGGTAIGGRTRRTSR